MSAFISGYDDAGAAEIDERLRALAEPTLKVVGYDQEPYSRFV
jgi:hypothetical protein